MLDYTPMSYLHLPRLHFYGKFKTTPSTLNNTPQNFDPKTPVEELKQDWNPTGAHWWMFQSVKITSLHFPGTRKPASDALIGAEVRTTNEPHVAKLVDLDPQQQLTSEIFGMQLKIGHAHSNYVIANFRTVAFSDLFSRVENQPPADSNLSAYYHSVLDVVKWSKDISSPFLKALHKASPNRLSIKFNVDGFDPNIEDPVTFVPNPNFSLGRLAGTIGPHYEGEPPTFLSGRLLKPTETPHNRMVVGKFNYTPALLDVKRKVLLFDLGNTVPTVTAGGLPAEVGQLHGAILRNRGKAIILEPLDYTDPTYRQNAGVQEFPLNAAQFEAARKSPLAIVHFSKKNAAGTVRIQENPTGVAINVVQRVYRMNPGDKVQVQLRATRFGEPFPGETIKLFLDPSILNRHNTEPGPKWGVPADVLSFPEFVQTDKNGDACFEVTAVKAPGNPRKYIDGQIYLISFVAEAEPQPGPNRFISIRVFDDLPIPDKPTWWGDIVPMFQQYVRLYPFMQDRMDLGDYPTASQGIRGISSLILSTSEDDPRYMPITRDMSAAKKKILKRWIEQGMPQGKKAE